jgi:hypothetical protein
MYEATRRLHSCGIFPEMVECWEEEFYRLYKTKPKKGEYVRAVKFTRCVVDNYNKLIDVL